MNLIAANQKAQGQNSVKPLASGVACDTCERPRDPFRVPIPLAPMPKCLFPNPPVFYKTKLIEFNYKNKDRTEI
jgi:hypothetical protein